MRLEEVLPARASGRNIRRKTWGQYSFLGKGCDIISSDIDADDWEVVPKPPIVIDLVQYADGYKFDFNILNYLIETEKDGLVSWTYAQTYRGVGCTYMNKDKAKELTAKLNSGEWVLK